MGDGLPNSQQWWDTCKDAGATSQLDLHAAVSLAGFWSGLPCECFQAQSQISSVALISVKRTKHICTSKLPTIYEYECGVEHIAPPWEYQVPYTDNQFKTTSDIFTTQCNYL